MRVLLTSESFLPYLSGVTVSVDALARGLGARGHEVLVLAPRPADGRPPLPVGSPGPEPCYAWLGSYQAPVVVPPAYRMPWPVPWSPAVRRALAFGPDVVHAHSPFVTGILARRIARASGAPLVFTHHTRFTDYRHYLGALAGPGARLLDAHLRRFWLGCAAIVAPSENLAAEIRSRLPAERARGVRVIPTGIDVAGIRGAAAVDARAAAGWPPESLVVVSLGRLAAEKSPGLVLEAVADAVTRLPLLRLLVIGGGPLEARLRARAAAADLAARVHFTGPLQRLEALAWVAGGDVFLFASRTETQGLVLAEALAAGLPAIAVDGPGVRDSVRDGVDGIVVGTEPSASLAHRLGEAVVGLASDVRARARMARRARDDADRFAVERRVQEVEELYHTLRAAPR